MAFTISKASAEEFDIATAFLQEYFVKEVPVSKIFGLDKDKPPYIPNDSDAEFILKAEDAEGQLVGVAFTTDKPTALWEKDKSPAQKEVVEFFEFFEAGCRLDTLPREMMEVWLMAVHPNWRGKGVARALVVASEREAKAAGFKVISITGVSEYTARLARSLGWKLQHSLAYIDYPRLSGRNVRLTPYPPHNVLTYYIKEL